MSVRSIMCMYITMHRWVFNRTEGMHSFNNQLMIKLVCKSILLGDKVNSMTRIYKKIVVQKSFHQVFLEEEEEKKDSVPMVNTLMNTHVSVNNII